MDQKTKEFFANVVNNQITILSLLGDLLYVSRVASAGNPDMRKLLDKSKEELDELTSGVKQSIAMFTEAVRGEP